MDNHISIPDSSRSDNMARVQEAERMKLIIPGQPKAQKRHRTGKNGRYDPSAKDKTSIRKALLQIKPANIIEEALSVRITAFFQTPKSWARYKRQLHEGKYRPKKPDCDNIAKIYLDAMSGMIFKDDNQVVDIQVRKYYSEKPCTILTIEVI